MRSRTTHLENLRRWRNRSPKDLTLAKLPEHLHRTVIKPHEQLGSLALLWREMVPPGLLERTALASFSRSVLTVQVADSSTLYELDRLLRSGLERQLKSACKTTLRRIRCTIGTSSRGGQSPF